MLLFARFAPLRLHASRAFPWGKHEAPLRLPLANCAGQQTQ